MAKRLAIPSKELQLYLVGSKSHIRVPRVQRLTMNTDIPSTTIDELGNSSHVGDVKDIPNVTVTFSVLDTGIATYATLVGQDTAAYTAADIVNLGEIDVILYVKDASITDYVKAASARKLQIRDFSFSYSVDGESTEEYTAVGSEKRWFSNDIQVDKFTTGTTSFTLSQTPVALKNSNKAISVILDGAYLTETSGAPATGEYRIVGTTLTTGDSMSATLMVVYQCATASPTWEDVNYPTTVMPAAIRGMDVGVTIAANSIPRVQSITINGTLNVQPVREMGSRQISGYQRQVPEVTGTITVLDTDTELISLLQHAVTSSGTEYAPGEGCTQTDVSLDVILYDPCDDTSPYTVLKTVYIDKISVVGDSYTSNVNQNAQQTFNFKSLSAHCVVYSGART